MVARLRIAAFVLVFAALAFADTFVMKDGRKLEGKVTKETATSYFVETGVGAIEIKKSDVAQRIVGKTPREDYAGREAAAKSAEDFFQLGNWANENKLGVQAKKCWKKAVELESQHEGANKALGNVLYKGRWMTPDARDAQAKSDEETEMSAKGFVRWKDRWVTPEEQSKLEQGLILRDGKWLTEAESKRLDGLEEFNGVWYPKPEALARADVAAVEKLAGKPLLVQVNEQAILAGDFDAALLDRTSKQLLIAREWFDKSFQAKPGLELFGGALAHFYLWNHESKAYVDSVDLCASLTTTVPPGWAALVKERHGFFWIDPYPLSSARVWNRPDEDLVGHCVHHWGHMLIGRLGYDGRNLPPWYEEGFASLMEYRLFARNAVFCRTAATSLVTTGTTAKKAPVTFTFDVGMFREGAWKETLKNALAAGVVPGFDRLAQLDYGNLELLDIACGMAITWWLEENNPGALGKFHAALRKAQPPSPGRIVPDSRERSAQYNAAFQGAVGLGWPQADKAWRVWFAAR